MTMNSYNGWQSFEAEKVNYIIKQCFLDKLNKCLISGLISGYLI